MIKVILVNKTLSIFIALAFFFLFTSLLGFYNAIRPPKIISSITPQNLGLEYEDVSFTTNDGIVLAGWFIPKQSFGQALSKDSEAKTIILLHGYPADKGDIMSSMSFLNKEYNLFLFDFRYLGKSGGRISTAGAWEVRDIKAAIQHLKSRGIREVGVWGFSVGGATALMAAPEIPEVRAIVTNSSYARLDLLMPDLYSIPGLRHILGYLTRGWGILLLGIDAKKIAPVESVKSLRIPIAIIHSKDDTVIPFYHAQLLQEALQDNPHAEFWFREKAFHGEVVGENQTRIKEFFAKNL